MHFDDVTIVGRSGFFMNAIQTGDRETERPKDKGTRRRSLPRAPAAALSGGRPSGYSDAIPGEGSDDRRVVRRPPQELT